MLSTSFGPEDVKAMKKVSFATNTVIKKKKLRSGPNSYSSFREKNNISPFNATLSQIEADDSRENNSSSNMTLTPKNLGNKSIKVSKLSFMDTQGDGLGVEDLSALGSISAGGGAGGVGLGGGSFDDENEDDQSPPRLGKTLANSKS